MSTDLKSLPHRGGRRPLFRSDLAGLTWPALLKGQAAQLATTLYQLEDSQWWPPAQLRQAQQRQLRVLLRHVLKNVSYYRKAYRGLGRPETLIENWAKVPVLSRPDVQQAGKTLFSKALPKEHAPVQAVRTSGSTGRPVEALSTAVTRFFWNACTVREHLWHGRDFKGTLAAIRPDRKTVPGGSASPSWGPPVDLLFKTGPSALLHSSTPIDAQLEWLRKQNPAYLLSLPTNLHALAEMCRDKDIKLPKLKEVRSYGETVRPKLRKLVREVWNAPVTDVYSTQEVGNIALQCPESGQYHLQSEHLLIEIVDDNGQPCREGEIGRVLVTTLHNLASPLIRYEIGDHAEVGAPCVCGRGLPVIRRVLGRERNLVVLPDGRRHWPSFPEEDWMAAAPIQQLQLVQKTIEHIEARVVAPRELTTDEQKRLSEIFTASLGHAFAFDYMYVDDIPRGPNGKFEDFISEVTVTAGDGGNDE